MNHLECCENLTDPGRTRNRHLTRRPTQRTGPTTTITQPANRPSHPADRGKPGDARHKGKRPRHHDQPRAARTTRKAGSTKNGTKDARLKRHQIEGMAHLASPSQHSSGSPPHAPTSPTLASHAAQPSALAPHAPGSASVECVSCASWCEYEGFESRRL